MTSGFVGCVKSLKLFSANLSHVYNFSLDESSLHVRKYSDIGKPCNNNNNNNNGRYTFEPIAIETLGVFNTSARQLMCDLGSKISENVFRDLVEVFMPPKRHELKV